MSKTKNKFSTCIVYDKKNNVIGYLSMKDESNGVDIILDKKGYKIVAL
jgi:hypothetical protein